MATKTKSKPVRTAPKKVPAGTASTVITEPERPVIDTTNKPQVPNDQIQPQQVVLDDKKRLQNNVVDDLFALKVVAEHVKPVADALKAEMLKNSAKYADGTFAFGRVAAGGAIPTKIDTVKFLRFCRKAKLSDTEIAAMISISGTDMKTHFTQNEIDACTVVDNEAKPREPSLTIDVAKGVAVPDVAACVQRVTNLVATATAQRAAAKTQG